jgi:hypothetical protein
MSYQTAAAIEVAFPDRKLPKNRFKVTYMETRIRKERGLIEPDQFKTSTSVILFVQENGLPVPGVIITSLTPDNGIYSLTTNSSGRVRMPISTLAGSNCDNQILLVGFHGPLIEIMVSADCVTEYLFVIEKEAI